MTGGHGGGRGGRRRGAGHAEGHENAERWMVTYADMLTLLLVLFIVLYSISAVNIAKFNQLKTSLSSAFNGGTAPSVLTGGQGVIAGQPKTVGVQVGPQGAPSTNSTTGRPTAAAVAEATNFTKIETQTNKALKASGLAGSALYTVNQRGLVVTVLTNEVVFGGDSAVLEPTGAKILNAIMPSLNTVDNQIEVDGNTNQLPSPVDGWQLSSDRAVRVLEYLVANGHISPARLTSSGHGEYVPLVPVSNPNAATLNKRVDIVVLSKYAATDRSGLFNPSAATS